jgi:hypothetical protein
MCNVLTDSIHISVFRSLQVRYRTLLSIEHFRQKILNFWQFSGLVIIFLLIAIGYGCMHGYTFYPWNPKINASDYTYIIDAEFWKDPQGRLPVYVVADLV